MFPLNLPDVTPPEAYLWGILKQLCVPQSIAL
jgi:hypothetical protein